MTKNSNIIHIAMDYEKRKKRQELARLLNQVTELCAQKGIKWEVVNQKKEKKEKIMKLN